MLKKCVTGFFLLASLASYAQQGILPGEPDPSRRTDKALDGEDTSLIDDRKMCPPGTKRHQKMKCDLPKSEPTCQNYAPVLECLKVAPRLNCKEPKVLQPVYRCMP